MSRLLRRAAMTILATGVSFWPLAALAYDGAEATAGTPGGFAILRAYIDPGAGGFIIVTVLGFISAVGYMARSYLSRLKAVVFKSRASAKAPRDGEER